MHSIPKGAAGGVSTPKTAAEATDIDDADVTNFAAALTAFVNS